MRHLGQSHEILPPKEHVPARARTNRQAKGRAICPQCRAPDRPRPPTRVDRLATASRTTLGETRSRERGSPTGAHPQGSMAEAVHSLYPSNRPRTGGIQERTTGDSYRRVPHQKSRSLQASCPIHSRNKTSLPNSIRGHALNSSLARASRSPPHTRMGTKRCREPSTDLTPILEKWLQFGLRVIALEDSIRQLQRRVILLRLRKASADGILAHIVQTLHECVQHAPPPALLCAF